MDDHSKKLLYMLIMSGDKNPSEYTAEEIAKLENDAELMLNHMRKTEPVAVEAERSVSDEEAR